MRRRGGGLRADADRQTATSIRRGVDTGADDYLTKPFSFAIWRPEDAQPRAPGWSPAPAAATWHDPRMMVISGIKAKNRSFKSGSNVEIGKSSLAELLKFLV